MISLLSCGIGRGHPFYMDGLAEGFALNGDAALVRRRSDVFAASSGLARLAWSWARACYHLAALDPAVAAPYHLLRRTLERDRSNDLMGRLLGRDLARWAGPEGWLVADHAMIVRSLGARRQVAFLHVELSAPAPALVHADTIIVPTAEVADRFVAAGIPRTAPIVTGVCIEPRIAARATELHEARRARLEPGTRPLTVGFFSSGAEPRRHVNALARAATAHARAGGHAVVVAARGGRLEAAVRRASGRAAPDGLERIGFSGRAELDDLTVARFPELDVVVSPPHERVSWAVALGLPFVLVGPDIGPFSAANRQVLLERGVATEAGADADGFPSTLARLRADGTLARQADAGFGLPVDGFTTAARALAARARG